LSCTMMSSSQNSAKIRIPMLESTLWKSGYRVQQKTDPFNFELQHRSPALRLDSRIPKRKRPSLMSFVLPRRLVPLARPMRVHSRRSLLSLIIRASGSTLTRRPRLAIPGRIRFRRGITRRTNGLC
jgi:hypothetical protein